MSQNHDVVVTYVSPNNWYVLTYPETWEVEDDEDCTTFVKRYAGVGALQISAYETDVPQSALENLLEYFKDERIRAEIETNITDEGQQSATGSFEKKGSFTRVWFITKGSLLLFVTYNCDPQSKTLDADDVDTILSSLRIAD